MAANAGNTGMKVLAGIAGFMFLVSWLSDPPEGDPWGSGADEADGAAVDEATDDPWGRSAAAATGGRDRSEPTLPPDDPWTRGSPRRGGGGDGDRGGSDPAVCEGTAAFSTDGGVVHLPVRGPVVFFPSRRCRLDVRHEGTAEAVLVLQHALVACNGQRLTLDGVHGPETRDAVAAVQEAAGVTIDGVYGPETREAMTWPATPSDPDDRDQGTTCVPAP